MLADGREMITTTTITINDDGERVTETVTELVESEEVEVEEEEADEPAEEDVVEDAQTDPVSVILSCFLFSTERMSYTCCKPWASLSGKLGYS